VTWLRNWIVLIEFEKLKPQRASQSPPPNVVLSELEFMACQKTEPSSRGGARTTRGESQGGGKQLDTNDHLRSRAGIHCAKRELR